MSRWGFYVGLAVSCRRGGRSFLARTERPSGSASPPFGGRATVARDTGDVCDGITTHWYGGPQKSVSDSESDGRSYIVRSPSCRLPPRPTRFTLPTSRNPSLSPHGPRPVRMVRGISDPSRLEAGGSASKDAERNASDSGGVRSTVQTVRDTQRVVLHRRVGGRHRRTRGPFGRSLHGPPPGFLPEDVNPQSPASPRFSSPRVCRRCVQSCCRGPRQTPRYPRW